MHNACRPRSETLPTASSEAGCEPRNWQMAAPVATVHAPMATSSSPPLSRGLCSHKGWGWTSRHYPQRTCLSLGKVNICLKRQKQFFSVQGKRSCKHKVAHSKETDELHKPSSAKPSVKGLHIHQHKWLVGAGGKKCGRPF